jgi:hypothetical protein
LRKAEEAAVAARTAAAAAKAKLMARAKGSKKSGAAKAIAAKDNTGKHNTGKTVATTKASTGGKNGRPNRVIAVVSNDKPAKPQPASVKSAKSKPEKSRSDKPIRLVDARGSR